VSTINITPLRGKFLRVKHTDEKKKSFRIQMDAVQLGGIRFGFVSLGMVINLRLSLVMIQQVRLLR